MDSHTESEVVLAVSPPFDQLLKVFTQNRPLYVHQPDINPVGRKRLQQAEWDLANWYDNYVITI